MTERQFQFDWDEARAAGNLRKHGIFFEMARAVFYDPSLLSVPDLAHSGIEERWFSVGRTPNGTMLPVVYLWCEMSSTLVEIRLISARKATSAETRQYLENR